MVETIGAHYGARQSFAGHKSRGHFQVKSPEDILACVCNMCVGWRGMGGCALVEASCPWPAPNF